MKTGKSAQVFQSPNDQATEVTWLEHERRSLIEDLALLVVLQNRRLAPHPSDEEVDSGRL